MVCGNSKVRAGVMCIDDLDLQRVDPIYRVTSSSMGQLAIVSVFIFMRNGMDYIVLFSGIMRTKICF